MTTPDAKPTLEVYKRHILFTLAAALDLLRRSSTHSSLESKVAVLVKVAHNWTLIMEDYSGLLKNLSNEILIMCLLLAFSAMGYMLSKKSIEMDALTLKYVEAIRTHAPETTTNEILILDKYRDQPSPDITPSGMYNTTFNDAGNEVKVKYHFSDDASVVKEIELYGHSLLGKARYFFDGSVISYEYLEGDMYVFPEKGEAFSVVGDTFFIVRGYDPAGGERKMPLRRSTPASDISSEANMISLSSTTIGSTVAAIFLSFIPVFLFVFARKLTRER